MAGSLSIPNTFATQSGNVPVSQLDTNLTTISTYVNAREVTLGVLGSRPSAGVSGRLYVATDVNGGTLYEDNGSAWTQIAGGVSNTSVGAYQGRGFRAGPNAGTPTTSYDMSAELVQLRSTSDGTVVVRTNTGTLTNDVTLAGSAANGRDQAGAFTASTHVHFYFIWNGTTLATLSSATAPPTGPTLPSTYTHWAYAACVRFDSASHLVGTDLRGSWMRLRANSVLITDGRVTSAATINFTNFIPTNTITIQVQQQWQSNSAVHTEIGPYLNGLNVAPFSSGTFLGATPQIQARTEFYTNVNQNLYYQNSADPGATNGVYMALQGFQLPNGGE